MTVREYLNRGYDLKRQIMLKRQQLENISESMTNLSVNLDGVKVIKTPTASCIENGVVQVIELKEDIDKSVAMLAVVGNEAVQIISKLQDLRTETMLIKHYVGFKTWNDVAQEMNITYKTVMNSHHYAMTKLTRILKDSPILEVADVAQ
jgi:DNA-directed RNA polymerase specialized sigma subunit, sigma24 homolog